jgi:hypothetical protein
MDETRSQYCTHAEFLANLARVSLLALVSRDDRRRPHDQRANPREFRNHCIRQ